ncbi:hypothetical protein GCM10010349_01730 [Streptomyces flavofungini]|nr:hypothetical protein GCM10010349_01730 [Streptomyces flavofungini]
MEKPTASRLKPQVTACDPRTCGGGPDSKAWPTRLALWSLRLLGWSHDRVAGGDLDEVVPAHTGVVPG